MHFEPLTQSDLPYLKEFEPPNWGDLVPRFQYCIESSFCNPVKMLVNERTVAIGTTILHRDSAWLASIIVHPEQRNRGYGKLITKQLIDTINDKRYTTIYLDATDLGYPVYKKLGFALETTYAHLKSASNISGLELSCFIIPYSDEYLKQLLDLDKMISCEDRQDIIKENLSTAKLYLHKEKVQGFYLPSLGNGLIIAENETAGIELVRYRLENNYYAIMPSDNKAAINFLEKNNLEQFRISRRMFIGKKRPWQYTGVYNRISGQLG